MTEASDLFSFGLLLQELVTGAPALDAETPEDLFEKTGAGERRPLPGTVAGDVRQLLDRLLEWDPARRPTAAETLEGIRWIRDRPRRRRRRLLRIAVAAVVGLALLVAAVAAVDSWQSRLRAERQTVVARQLGEEVSAIETLLRLGHLAPPHDVGVERGQAEKCLAALEKRFAGEGPWAQGPLAYARGRVTGEPSIPPALSTRRTSS